MKKVPFVTLDKLQEITAQFPTPFHLYDEKGIRENAKAVKEAFAWNKGFKEFFAVKATPNPFLIQILQEYGCGCDCSSMTELMMSKAIGCKEGDIMFSSNDTPEEEFKYANEIGGIITLDDITSERILQMKGILAEPGKAPVIASLPDSLWAIENRLGTPCEMIVMPRTPAVLFVGRYEGPIQPASLLNRKYRGRQLYGPILCYGWKGNNIQPMNKDVQTEMLDRLKGTEVRVWSSARTATMFTTPIPVGASGAGTNPHGSGRKAICWPRSSTRPRPLKSG